MGVMRYQDDFDRIPHAAIIMEDAMMLHRMADRGERLVVRLEMSARTEDDVESRNGIVELRGSEFPDEVVVLGGHIDSWNVGQGAMDDAGGVVDAWEAVRLMKELGLRPRRTGLGRGVDERGEWPTGRHRVPGRPRGRDR